AAWSRPRPDAGASPDPSRAVSPQRRPRLPPSAPAARGRTQPQSRGAARGRAHASLQRLRVAPHGRSEPSCFTPEASLDAPPKVTRAVLALPRNVGVPVRARTRLSGVTVAIAGARVLLAPLGQGSLQLLLRLRR